MQADGHTDTQFPVIMSNADEKNDSYDCGCFYYNIVKPSPNVCENIRKDWYYHRYEEILLVGL